jgi:transcriptional regulator GlxA family with amidase domain
MDAVRPHVRSDTAAFIEYCLARAGESVSIAAAAGAFGIDRKTLLNRLTVQNLPVPRHILVWCRLLIAARLLEDPGRSIEQVGFAMGCGSGAGLRNLFVRHTSLRPGQVRALGGMNYMVDLFLATLRNCD